MHNPKAALLFLAFLPQFIATDSRDKVAAFLPLGLTFVTTGTLWALALAFAAAHAGAYLAHRRRGRVLLLRTKGGLFVLPGMPRLAARPP